LILSAPARLPALGYTAETDLQLVRQIGGPISHAALDLEGRISLGFVRALTKNKANPGWLHHIAHRNGLFLR